MKEGHVALISFIFLGFLFFSVGFLANDAWGYYQYDRELNGFLLRNANITEVKQFGDLHDERGDWICVNVKGMAYEKALQTCNHEVGHEIFAEFCADNIDECIAVTEIRRKTNNDN